VASSRPRAAAGSQTDGSSSSGRRSVSSRHTQQEAYQQICC
jgi:hypothetical protein